MVKMAFEYIDIYIYLICMYSKWASVVGVVNGQKVRDFGEIFLRNILCDEIGNVKFP